MAEEKSSWKFKSVRMTQFHNAAASMLAQIMVLSKLDKEKPLINETELIRKLVAPGGFSARPKNDQEKSKFN